MLAEARAVTSLRRRNATRISRRILKHWEYYLLVLVPMAYFVIFKYVPDGGCPDRVPGLQRHPGHVGQPLGRIARVHALLRVAELLATDREHLLHQHHPAAARLPGPDHPGAGAQRDQPTLLQAVGADGHLRAALHLHGGDGVDDHPVPEPEARPVRRADAGGRSAAGQLPGGGQQIQIRLRLVRHLAARRLRRHHLHGGAGRASIPSCTRRRASTGHRACRRSSMSTSPASCR